MTQANGHAHPAPAKHVPALYLSLIAELQRRRIALGLSLVQLDEAIGWSESFSTKCLYPARDNGRCMSWASADEVVQVLFPAGVSLRLVASDGARVRHGSLANEAQGSRSLIRHYLQKIAAAGGRASWSKLSPEQRSARASHAGKASAQRRRERLERDKLAVTAKLEPRPRLGVGTAAVHLR